jgi:hypothetical protein
MVVGGCTVATCWHATLVLPVTTALVKRVRPLPTIAALSCAYALGTRDPSCTTEPTTSFFTLEVRRPLRAVGHVAALEPSRTGKSGPEPRVT